VAKDCNVTIQPQRPAQCRTPLSTVRVQRFRAKHRRFDYVPCPEALKVIDTWRAANPTLPLAAILDHLIVAGNDALIPSDPAAVR
jgi:hypothetical protein